MVRRPSVELGTSTIAARCRLSRSSTGQGLPASHPARPFAVTAHEEAESILTRSATITIVIRDYANGTAKTITIDYLWSTSTF